MSENTIQKNDNSITVKNSVWATVTVIILMTLAILWANGKLPGSLIGFLWGLSLLIILVDGIILNKDKPQNYLWFTIIQIIVFIAFALSLYICKYSGSDWISICIGAAVTIAVFLILNCISLLLRLITPNILAFLITLSIGIFSIGAHGFDNKLISIFISSLFSSYKDQLLGVYKKWYDHKFNNKEHDHTVK